MWVWGCLLPSRPWTRPTLRKQVPKHVRAGGEFTVLVGVGSWGLATCLGRVQGKGAFSGVQGLLRDPAGAQWEVFPGITVARGPPF